MPGYWVAGQQQEGRFVELAPGQEIDDGSNRPIWFFVVCAALHRMPSAGMHALPASADAALTGLH